jgi:hypothetical protein
MAKKAAPKPDETEDDSTGKTISKSEAARQALAAGLEGPEEATDFIKKTFGIEMSRSHFSAVKSQIKAKAEAPPAPRGKPGRKPRAAIEGMVKPPKPGSEAGLLEAMEAMKPLVASLGVEKVKRIAELLG